MNDKSSLDGTQEARAMPFKIVKRDDLSLLDLLRLHQAGEAVLKTPHVGNIYPNNLAIAMLGIPLLLVDRTIGAKDCNFHPHQLIHQRRAEEIAAPDLLTTHARILRPPTRFSDRFIVGERVLDAHVRSLREALPQARIETETERMRRLPDFFLALFEVLSVDQPSSWQRYVEPNGVVTAKTPMNGWRQVLTQGIHGLTDRANTGSWISPNSWSLVADGVLCAHTRGVRTVYELSGPDMVRYIGRHAAELNRAYDLARGRLFPQLPETLECVIVPVADMRLAVPWEERAALEAVVDAYLALQGYRQEAADRLRGMPTASQDALVASVREGRGPFQRRFQEAAAACPSVLYNIRRADFLSQYDLLSGTKLFLHPWGLESPMKDVMALIKAMDPGRQRERE